MSGTWRGCFTLRLVLLVQVYGARRISERGYLLLFLELLRQVVQEREGGGEDEDEDEDEEEEEEEEDEEEEEEEQEEEEEREYKGVQDKGVINRH
eukprot:s307_g6.t1